MIPLSKPAIGEDEKQAVLRVMDSGMLAQGPEVEALELEFAKTVGTEHAIAVNSGTSALLLSLMAAGIGVGDEVIVPSFTFAATANSVALAGAQPIFVDIDRQTYCLDPDAVEAAISSRTAAILPVHLYGHPADLGRLGAICRKASLELFEDAAQAHLATWDGRAVGSFGIGSFSFYPTKNMMSGEGGMITTSDDSVARRCRLLRNQGMERRYENEIAGFNCRMTDIHAAIGRAQLTKLEAWTVRRRAIAGYFSQNITTVETPSEASSATHVYHQYTVRVTGGRRDEFLELLGSNGIGAGVYYPFPVHQLPSFQRSDCLPETELAAKEVVSIPVHPALTDSEVEKIAEVVNGWS